MKCVLWLLFLPGFFCDENVLSITPQTIRAWEGSCVLISCSISDQYKMRTLRHLSFAWYFNPLYDNVLREYSGSLLYNSNWTSKGGMAPAQRVSNSQVGFVGDLANKNCSLKISQLHKNDSGTYGIRLYATAEELPNPPQKWFLQTYIQVYESPLEMMEIELPEMKELNEYIVTCSVSYHCLDIPIKLTFQGLEDHRLLSQTMTSVNRVVQTQLSLTSTWKDHGRQLACLLESQDGRKIKSKSKNLTVQYAPKGVTLRAVPGVIVQDGDRLSLECQVNSSNPKVTRYQWFKDDKVWNEWKTLSRMEFSDLKDKNSGNYKCAAINPFGKGYSENLKINVRYRPKINIQTSQQIIQEMDHVVLWCLAKANPPIHGYEWYRSSVPNYISTQQILQFEAIQPSDSDTYHCVVRNDIGKSNSSVTLNVQYRPKEVQLFHLNHLPIKEGDIIRLNCSVGSSFPTNWYNFLKSNVYLKKGWNSPLWDVSGSKFGSAHSYTCEACNSVGCTLSQPIILDVLYGPKDVRVTQNPWGFIKEGDFVELICAVGAANPQKLSYTWYKDEQLLPLNSIKNTVSIRNAHSRDSGSYRCETKNIVAMSQSPSLWLDVHYGPRNVCLTLDNPQAVTEGMDVYLRCDNDAHPLAITYKWYWNRQQIFKETSKIIVLRKVQVEQSGEYLCKASNQISEQESQLMFLTVSYSSATVMKHALIGLGIFCALVILLGLLLYSFQKWNKTRSSTTNSTQRSGSFFIKKAKQEVLPKIRHRQDGGGTGDNLAFPNEEAEEGICYAAVQFPPTISKEPTIYSRIKQQHQDSSNDRVIYSVVKRPGLPTKEDTKVDYENVVSRNEEELHYSSLVNLTPRSRPIYEASETDSESEESIQYASLKQ